VRPNEATPSTNAGNLGCGWRAPYLSTKGELRSAREYRTPFHHFALSGGIHFKKPAKHMTRYDRSPAEWKNILANPEMKAASEQWLEDNTVDSWRHARMRSTVEPFISQSRGMHSWLTIGDGRYGTDAHWLASMGENVHASDVDDGLLREGAAAGFIKEFSVQNAEALSLPDASFDYVFCKEALHHLPRPWLGLYEMTRVARRAVVLIEPNDTYAFGGHHVSVKSHLKRAVLRLVGRTIDPDTSNWHHHETVGNYLYRLRLHRRWIAFRGMNDRYIKGVESCPMTGGTPQERRLRARIVADIAEADRRARCLEDYNILCVALFVAEPEPALVQRLCAQGWLVKHLPVNPYLDGLSSE
jgi:ubiquinone/menaquinone biosynthesis C-methylase UbiE